MHRVPRVLLCTALALLGLTTTTSASAAAPERIHLEPGRYVFDAGVVCSVPVEYQELSSHNTLTFFADGRLFATGAYRVRLHEPRRPVEVDRRQRHRPADVG